MRSRLASNGLAVVLGLAIGLGIVEIALRATTEDQGYRFPSARITDDRFTSRAGRTLDDNGVHYRFDADGFRVGSAVPPPDARTILFIGDSFTEGMRVQAGDAFPAVTCDRLARDGARVRCLNAGVSGFGTAHELRLLRTLLQRKTLAVDAVVFQVLPNNDLRDVWEDGGFGLQDGRLATWDPPHVPLPVRLRDALLDNPWARGSRSVTVAANAWFNGLGMDPHYDDAAFELERALLQEVVATARGHEVPIVVVVCATAWEIGAPRSEPFDDRARLDFVVDAVKSLQVPWIDSRDVVGASEHYIPNDGHFSPAGHALIGDALAKRLTPFPGE